LGGLYSFAVPFAGVTSQEVTDITEVVGMTGFNPDCLAFMQNSAAFNLIGVALIRVR
jgi:hypothetical protein